MREKGVKVSSYSFKIRNLTIFGEAVEKKGRKFNLYILDKKGYSNYFYKQPFKAYYKGINSSSYSFTIRNYNINENNEVILVFERIPSKTSQITEKDALTITVPKECSFVDKTIKFFQKPPEAENDIVLTFIL